MYASNTGCALSSGNLLSALSQLSQCNECRELLISALRKVEATFPDRSINVREFVTGPVIDALFQKNELLQKEIEGGLRFCFRYSSKIARDFVFADRPDHVWEPQTTKLLCRLGQRAKIAVIAGAYFGDQAVLVANAMKAVRGVCYCFEPNVELVDLLRRNAQLNDLANLIPIQSGLWRSDEIELVLVGDDSHASTREAHIQDKDTFRPTTLDKFTGEHDVTKIDILMLDIEGGELAALQGASKFLQQPVMSSPNIIFEIHSAYGDWSRGLENTDIALYLDNFGYSLYAIRDYQGNVDMRGRPIEMVPIRKANIAGPPHGFNVFATKDAQILDWLEARLVENVSPKLLSHRDPKLHQPLC